MPTPPMTTHLGEYQPAVETALAELQADHTIDRIWRHDHTVWKPDPTEISNRLGWLNSMAVMRSSAWQWQTLVDDVQTAGYTQALLLGMGGSSLAPEVFRRTFGVRPGYLDLTVLDSTDPDEVRKHTDRLDYSKTLFIVSTKSGGTAETLSFFKYFYNQVSAALGAEHAGAHFIAITDPNSKLVDFAGKYNFRSVFLNDPNIGGRYSVLSFFGVIPAALLGVDVSALLARAEDAAAQARSAVHENDSAVLGAAIGELAKAGRDKLTFAASPGIASFGDWAEQLIAESTGKEGVGILPVVTETLGNPENYAGDRVFVHLRVAGDDRYDAQIQALQQAGHPVFRLDLADEYDLGGQFFFWEMATIVAGARLGINPFDQPNVESAKVVARATIAAYESTGEIPASDTEAATQTALYKFLSGLKPGNYVSIHAYIPHTNESDALLKTLSTQIRDRYKAATTIGYGPRFLHSTGQLHKGDGGNGLFIQITSDAAQDLPIPDVAGADESAMPFGVLKLAQAVGDGRALQDEGRQLIRFHLGTDVIGGLQGLVAGS